MPTQILIEDPSPTRRYTNLWHRIKAVPSDFLNYVNDCFTYMKIVK
jgi:hypothetical protein